MCQQAAPTNHTLCTAPSHSEIELHLGTICGVDGAVDIGRVAPKLFQQAAGFDAVHAYQAIEGRAQHM